MLFTFPSRYWYTIGLTGVFSLAGWSPCPALLRVPLCPERLRVRGFHPLRPPFPERSARLPRYNVAALLPRGGRNRRGLGSSPVARHYWGNHCCFLFLRVLRCFSSPRLPHRTRGDDGLMAAGLSHWPFAPTRGFSQLTTSFFASVSLGIHHAPLLSFSSSRAGRATRAGPGVALLVP